MKIDSIFYQLFQVAPAIFFELIGVNTTNIQNYQFRSIELKQTAFRIDGVFLPLNNTQERPVYFVEVQFQKDSYLYHRFFAEIFLFLDQNKLTNDWHAVVIYPRRSIEPDETWLYRSLLASSQVQRVYLDELEPTGDTSIGLGIVQLIVEKPASSANKARELIRQAGRSLATSDISTQEIIELIETIIVYKFPQLSRQEVEEMLGLSELKQTRVYQEALEEGRQEGRQEGKLAAVPLLLQAGVSIEQIAQQLDLDVAAVRQIAQQQ